MRASNNSCLLLTLLLAAQFAAAQTPARSGAARSGAASNQTGFVTPVPVDGLVDKPANLFDLQGRTVRFTPQPDGSYKSESLRSAIVVPCNTALDDKNAIGGFFCRSWEVTLPFAFPFAGKTWQKIYVNRNGNISFEKPEEGYWGQRDPWADGGIRSVAAAIDSRSAAGMESMIAGLWAQVETNPALSDIRIQQANDGFAVTWNVMRVAWGQARAGVNTFQVRLLKTGVIEMVYPRVVDQDGIVGVFPGNSVTGKRLFRWDNPHRSPHPSVAMDFTEIHDAGSTLKFIMTMKENVSTSVSRGMLDYRGFIEHERSRAQFGVSVSETLGVSCWLGPSPRTAGYRISGKSTEIHISKVLLPGVKKFKPSWDVVWWGMDGRNTGSGNDLPEVDLSQSDAGEVDLSGPAMTRAGSLFEVFHHAAVTKGSENILAKIYAKSPGKDDIALVFTDFRIDDLYGMGGGAIAANLPIKGIGPGQDKPRSTKHMGNEQLQLTMATVWIGAPLFDEAGADDKGKRWNNFAHGTKWVAHEGVHRWGMALSFKHPRTGTEQRLVDGNGHWVESLNTTAAIQVAGRYLATPGIGNSVMGGIAWAENSDNTFSKSNFDGGIPGGFSTLDLYVMGMLPPERVLPTFLLEDLKDLGNNRFSAAKIPVRIEDIVAIHGPREPAFANSQKTWRMTLYLVHDPTRPVNPQMLARARGLSNSVADFFTRATGGVMKIVPGNAP